MRKVPRRARANEGFACLASSASRVQTSSPRALTACPSAPYPFGAMKIFIDTADLGEIRDAAAMGVIDGVTTNPSLIAQAKRPLQDVIRDICEIVDGPISAEV